MKKDNMATVSEVKAEVSKLEISPSKSAENSTPTKSKGKSAAEGKESGFHEGKMKY